ncbi:MAG: flippase [Solobacterium sp.]|nr:flippase [Solobacterium sp.]
MEKKPSIKKNFIMNAILTMSSVIFPFISFRYVSGILGPGGTGKVSFAASVISYFWIIACLGVPTYGIRAVAKARDDREKLTRTVHELFFISMIMTIIAYILLFIALAVVPKFQQERTLFLIISLEMILYTIGMDWLYKGLEKYTYITIQSILCKIVAILLMFLLIREQNDYRIYGFLTIFAAGASHILYFINAHRYIDMKWVGNYDLKQHMKPVFIFFAMSCATTIYTHLDSVMLGFLASDTDVGYYGAATKIKAIMVSVVTSLGHVLLPRASYYIQNNDMVQFRRISEKALNFVSIISVPIFTYFILYASSSILFVSTAEYLPAVPAMQWIMPTLLFIGLTNILGIQMLVPLGREKAVLYSEIAGAIVDMAINWLLIPKYRAAGAAIGTLIAEAVVLLVQYIALRGEVSHILKRIHWLLIFIATAAACGASFWVMNLHMGPFMTLLVSAMIFFSVYAAILLIFREKMAWEIVNTVFRKLKRRHA